MLENQGIRDLQASMEVPDRPRSVRPPATQRISSPTPPSLNLQPSSSIAHLFRLFITDPSIAQEFFSTRLEPQALTRIQALLSHIQDPVRMPTSALDHLLKPRDPATPALIARYLYYGPPASFASVVIDDEEKERARPESEMGRLRMKGSWWALLSAWILGEAFREKARREAEVSVLQT